MMKRSGRCFASPLAMGRNTCELMATLPGFTTSKFMESVPQHDFEGTAESVGGIGGPHGGGFTENKSLPVPLSPWIRMVVASLAATLRTNFIGSVILPEMPSTL
jgi:hypothetical protein